MAAKAPLAVDYHQAAPKSVDLSTVPIESLSWSGEEAVSSLGAVYRFVDKQAQDAITWYYAKKKPKAVISRALRLIAIVFAMIGGLIPIAVNIPVFKQTWMLERWGFVLFGLAAACVALDRFFGFSTGWIRYITAAQMLQNQLYAFRMDWARAASKLGGNAPTSSEIEEFFRLAKDFSARVMQEVTQETQQWVMEFQSSLADLEKTTRTQSEATRPGSLTVSLENADYSEQPVAVHVDGVAYGVMSGSTWGIRQLSPGTHLVVVSGQKDGTKLQETATATVPPGGTADLKLRFRTAAAPELAEQGARSA